MTLITMQRSTTLSDWGRQETVQIDEIKLWKSDGTLHVHGTRRVERTSLHENVGVAVGREEDITGSTDIVAVSSPAQRAGGQCELRLRRWRGAGECWQRGGGAAGCRELARVWREFQWLIVVVLRTRRVGRRRRRLVSVVRRWVHDAVGQHVSDGWRRWRRCHAHHVSRLSRHSTTVTALIMSQVDCLPWLNQLRSEGWRVGWSSRGPML